MTADELRAALEVELAWRQEELAFFKNQLSEIVEESKNNCHQRARRIDARPIIYRTKMRLPALSI